MSKTMDSVNKFNEIRLSNFVVAGFASVGATVVTNPIEVRVLSVHFVVNIKVIFG